MHRHSIGESSRRRRVQRLLVHFVEGIKGEACFHHQLVGEPENVKVQTQVINEGQILGFKSGYSGLQILPKEWER